MEISKINPPDIIEVIEKPFTWGTKNLDKVVSPIQRDSFIIFAGQSGHGKSAFSFDMAIKNAQLGHMVVFFSIEMAPGGIELRIAREYAGILKEQWRDKTLISPTQKQAYLRRKKELNDVKNLFNIGFENEDPSLMNIFTKIRILHPDLVFIDNFDLIQKPEGVSEYQAETKIASELMRFCHQEQFPIVVLHHMRKGNEKEQHGSMNAIRGSGKIVHDADMAIIGARTKYKENMTNEEKAAFTIMQIKDRDFGTGCLAKVYFHKGSFYDTMQDNYSIAKDIFDDNLPF